MSTLLLATSCALLLGQADSGRSGQLNRSDVDEGKTCVCIKKLELPGYPPLALFARLTGTATADVSLGPSGAIEKIGVSGVPEVLKGEVSSKLSVSEFSSTCEGVRLRLLFTFVIAGSPTDKPETSVTYSPPNRFTVSTRPAAPMP